jgi:hypothetical protein
VTLRAPVLSACILIVSIICACDQPAIDQNDVDQPVSETPDDVVFTVYAAGYCKDTSGVQVPGYWKDGTWIQLPALGSYPAQVVALVISGGDIYAGGWCWSGSSSSTQVSGIWKNGTWTQLGSQTITSLVLNGNDVYAGGYYRVQAGTYGKVPAPGYWKNGSWTDLETQSIYGASVTSMVVSGGYMYAGGYATIQTGSAPVTFVAYPGYWVDGNWTELSHFGFGGRVSSLATFSGLVYAGGTCSKGRDPQDPQTTLYEAGYWRNGQWFALSSNLNSVSAGLIAANDTDVYVYGNNGTAAGFWKNGNWTGMTAQATVNALTVAGSDFYMAGSDSSSGVSQPGYWKNLIWNELPPINPTFGGQATCIVVVEK